MSLRQLQELAEARRKNPVYSDKQKHQIQRGVFTIRKFCHYCPSKKLFDKANGIYCTKCGRYQGKTKIKIEDRRLKGGA